MTGLRGLAATLVLGAGLTASSAVPLSQPVTLSEYTQAVIRLELQTGMYDSYLENYYADLKVDSALALSREQIIKLTVPAKFTFLGDSHEGTEAVDLLREVVLLHLKEHLKPVLVIEFIFARYQRDVDAYLKGEILLSQLRKNVRFDQYHWAWKWDDISQVLVLAKERGLRVIAGEEGSNNMNTRDAFTARVIADDVAKNPGGTYVILYGTLHLLGDGHLPRRLQVLAPGQQIRIVNFLGRKTEEAIRAVGTMSDRSFLLEGATYYVSRKTPFEELRSYYDYLLELSGLGGPY